MHAPRVISRLLMRSLLAAIIIVLKPVFLLQDLLSCREIRIAISHQVLVVLFISRPAPVLKINRRLQLECSHEVVLLIRSGQILIAVAIWTDQEILAMHGCCIHVFRSHRLDIFLGVKVVECQCLSQYPLARRLIIYNDLVLTRDNSRYELIAVLILRYCSTLKLNRLKRTVLLVELHRLEGLFSEWSLNR